MVANRCAGRKRPAGAAPVSSGRVVLENVLGADGARRFAGHVGRLRQEEAQGTRDHSANPQGLRLEGSAPWQQHVLAW
ncbi:unnamed protein product [Toxocara canis]|uniref:Uncharacterized protein n=1 Tax=Toxocara canis TaxID=6265 RepID=A0A183UKY5_TOXCA|nr:unnamed protein product [Toxocara canis]